MSLFSGNSTVNSSITATGATIGANSTVTSFVANATGIYVNATMVANSTGPYGKTEGNLNVNNATTAYGKAESALNVNNATTAYGKTEGNLNVNNATTAYGKTEGALNVNSATQATNATNLNSQPGSYYTNATNISTGTLALARGGTNSTLTIVSGGVVYSNATGMAITAAGTNTQVLVSNGTAPVFAQIDMAYLPESTFKKSCRAATTADLSAASATAQVLTGGLVALPAQDGVTLALNDRLLVWNQSNTAQNGIYYVSNTGSAGVHAWTLTRVNDANTSSRIASGIVAIDQGTSYGGRLFDNDFKTTDTLGTTGMSWNYNIDAGGGVFTGSVYPNSNTLLLGNATSRWVISANTVDASGAVNAASHTVGTAFTANATVVNAVSYYAGTTLIGNTTGPYGKAESALNVNNATTAYSKTEGNLNVNSAATLATPRSIGDVSFNGSASIVPERLLYKDTRSTNYNPFSYLGATLHLKTNTTDSLSDGGTYHGVLDLSHWSDSSGGVNHQIGLTDNGNMYIRYSTGASTWSSWNVMQLNSTLNANIASYLPNYTGVVNASSFTVGSFFVANSTVANFTNTQTTISSDVQGSGTWNQNYKFIYANNASLTAPQSIYNDRVFMYGKSTGNGVYQYGYSLNQYNGNTGGGSNTNSFQIQGFSSAIINYANAVGGNTTVATAVSFDSSISTASINASGNIGTAYGVRVNINPGLLSTNAGPMGTIYGLRADLAGGATSAASGNCYVVYGNYPSNANTTGTLFGIYIAGASNNYFSGNTSMVGSLFVGSTVNAASHTVGTAFTANATVVNAVSYYAGTTLIGNTTGPYGKAESALNVNNATYAFGLSAASTTATGSTVVTRDANGDFNGRYINASYHNSSDDVSTGTLTYLMGKFGDNYHRSATAAKVATFLSGQSFAFTATQSIDVAGNQLYFHNGSASNTATLIHRNDGANYYLLLSANSTSVNGTWTASRPLTINMASGYLSSSNGQSFAGGMSVTGGISMTEANPTITSGSSYITIPNGLYVSGGTPYFQTQIQARGGIYNDSGVTLTLAGGTGGYTTVSGSCRSPLFYDSDNTGYVVDGAGTTTLNALTLGGLLIGRTSTGSVSAGNDTGSFSIRGDASNPAHVSFHRAGAYAINVGLDTDNVFRFGGWSDGAATYRLQLAAPGGTHIFTGTVSASADFRAPIFYDTNNTAYYTDPSGTSYCNNIQVAGSFLVGSSGTWAAGSLYSDGNWGMLFRAKQASPALAQFAWYESTGATQLLAIDTSYNLTTAYAIKQTGLPFHEMNNTVASNYTITTNYNAMSIGPVTINNGVTVTIPTGSNWVVV